ncbi:MAG: hypothetical protein E6L09_04380 [Verrucomicrobia bacterium]|nr:MAG: hypothetical protein E6L09_04380 [Verrucomicrobiota bacterium]
MFELKPLSPEAIPAALEKATRYRLLNEPSEAESICLDVLRTEPDHQQALVILLLALTDRFSRGYGVSDTQSQELLPRLHNDYDRTYYAGIICERKAKARLHQGGPGAGFNAFDLFREAMTWFEKAEKIRPAGNDDALLRWNTCARIIARNQLESRPQESGQLSLE